MKDRIPGAPGQYSAVVPGGEYPKMQRGEPFAITLTRDDQPVVEGTPYSKATVLPDDVAERLCPGVEDPTPADAFGTLKDHVINTSNPHGVTASQIEAAPSGYGLGSVARKNMAKCNTITKNGWYVTTPTAQDRPLWFPAETMIFVRAIDGDNLVQDAYDNNGNRAIRQRIGGVWGEWKDTNFTDHPIAEGTSGDWYYRKWANGVAECWIKGEVFQGDKCICPLPFPVAPDSVIMVSSEWGSQLGAHGGDYDENGNVTSVEIVARADDEYPVDVFYLYIIGRWRLE